MNKDSLVKYILGIADNSLILGQRLGELTGHGPTLEVDIEIFGMAAVMALIARSVSFPTK